MGRWPEDSWYPEDLEYYLLVQDVFGAYLKGEHDER